MSDIAVAESGTRLQNFLDRAGLRGFPWKTATILYTISWGWLLTSGDMSVLDEPLYWRFDGSTTSTNLGSANLRNMGFAPWAGFYSDKFIYLIDQIYGGFVFVVYFVIGVCSFGIVRRNELLKHSEACFCALLILLLPFNTSRISSMTLGYTISLLLFYMAWLLLIRSERRVLNLISLGLFFFSFSTHSLVFFFILPLLHVMIINGLGSMRRRRIWLLKNWTLFVPPVLYVGLRHFFWSDIPNYQDLNFVKVRNGFAFLSPFLALFFTLIVFKHGRRLRKIDGINTLAVGFFATVLGSIAYVLLGFYPHDFAYLRIFAVTFLGRSAWLSRHQLLQSLGLALVLVGTVQILEIKLQKVANFAKLVLISSCVLFSICFGFEYTVDSQKQDQILNTLANQKLLSSSNPYVFIDNAPWLNARGRPYRPFNLSVFLHRAKYRGDRDGLIREFTVWNTRMNCEPKIESTLVLIEGPETHWEALKNWVSDGDMGFKVTVDDSPGACKPEMVTNQRSSGAIPILFYFTGAKG